MEQSGYPPLSTVFLGSQALLIQCAEITLAQGIDIRLVASDDPQVLQWAHRKSLAVCSVGQLLDHAQSLTFDYLFSIVHLFKVDESLLALPRKGAINFHDAPLPAMGGLNTPAWALIEGRKQHGVTWHWMTKDIDQGGVLIAEVFPIDPDDTAFTLNARCFEQGTLSFQKLLDRLTRESLSKEGGEKPATLYNRSSRPKGHGAIDWSQSASTICNQLRGLDFGSYDNPLAVPKLVIEGTVFLIDQAEVVADANPSAQAPGTVLHNALGSGGTLDIALLDGALKIAKLQSPLGRDLEVADEWLAFKVGTCVDRDWPDDVAQLLDRSAVQEWSVSRQMADWEAMDLPFASPAMVESEAIGSQGTVVLARGVKSIDQDLVDMVKDPYRLLAGFALFFSRLVGVTSGCLAWSQQAARDSSLWLPVRPFRVGASSSQSSGCLMDEIGSQLKHLDTEAPPVMRDLLVRQSATRPFLVGLREGMPLVMGVSGGQTSAQDDFRVTAPGLKILLNCKDDAWSLEWSINTARVAQDSVDYWLGLAVAFCRRMLENQDRSFASVTLMDAASTQALLDWNATHVTLDSASTVHQGFERQVLATPTAPAVTFEGRTFTYEALNIRANGIARVLVESGVAVGDWVGVSLHRSDDMVASLLAVLKAGAAYVPLDPLYPEDRLLYMVDDAQCAVVLTESKCEALFEGSAARPICLDQLDLDSLSGQNVELPVSRHHLAYTIYTSGSTGKPKGVMVEHGNVLNFFAGMDDRVGAQEGGTWLAVTSMSFDISVLELFWTLSRGFHVVVYRDRVRESATQSPLTVTSKYADQSLDFSLFFWNLATDANRNEQDPYELVLRAAEYGDQHGFKAVWTPERHFHSFGGLYPNPAVTSAALAVRTKNIDIRAGSCVLPLHHPIRVAEDWSMVDNMSHGRVGLAMAAGWQPNDFAIRPEAFATAKSGMFEAIDSLRKLWRGEAVTFDGPNGPVDVSTLPRPQQKELPVWITAAGNPETFRLAGAHGYGILTHLLGQTTEELQGKLDIYRAARREAGHEGEGHIVVMLHTLVGADDDAVREKARAPMKAYLKSAMFLVKAAAWHFPTFKAMSEASGQSLDEFFDTISDEDLDGLLDFAFERYYGTSGLFGTPERCIEMVDRLKQLGVHEVGCLVDYGLSADDVVEHLPYLNQLRQMANRSDQMLDQASGTTHHTMAECMIQHQVTHFQCTPSMVDMVLADESSQDALQGLKVWMVGGEAFPAQLVERIKVEFKGRLLNMYGPTETTIWSTTQDLTHEDVTQGVLLGKPIANTQVAVVDSMGQPVPAGVPGELFIGGLGVVRGYANRPELTAERFVDDSIFKPDSGARLYRTGDLVRFNDDGRLEFLGRMDHQVKIRGYRVELGEIEALLDKMPSVRQSVVLLREDRPGQKVLVAYLETKGTDRFCSLQAKDELEQHLPAFMVPSYFVEIAVFPKTPNGKVDRKALPVPQTSHLEQSSVGASVNQGDQAPSSAMEQFVSSIWCDVLSVQQVGVNDNFFDIGGHSLLVIQVLSALREKVDKPLKMTDMFRYTTVAQIAEFLGEGANASSQSATAGQSRAALRKSRRRRT